MTWHFCGVGSCIDEYDDILKDEFQATCAAFCGVGHTYQTNKQGVLAQLYHLSVVLTTTSEWPPSADWKCGVPLTYQYVAPAIWL